MSQFVLFSVVDLTVPVFVRVRKAVDTLVGLFNQRYPIVIAYSGGKDSSCVVTLVFQAAKEVVAAGGKPVVALTHSDTRVENPEVAAYARGEMEKMVRWGRQHGFEVILGIAEPHDLSTWQAKILTGRGIPSFAGTSTDCSIDLKVEPQRRLRKQIFKTIETDGCPPSVTCLGTRFDESERRALHMKLRGENAMLPVRNKDGDLVLSPISMWTDDDVWEHLGTAGASGEHYSDFKECFRIYAHAEGQGCAIVASAINEGGQSRKKGGCGARHGCFVCQQAVDKSLENMVAFDERYAYARGLLRLNKFIRHTRYDWSRRHHVGRTIREGYVAIEPDTYHPAMIRDLLRYMLQLDYDELVLAHSERRAPMFRILPESMLFLIDAYWSINGLAYPFSAVVDYVDVFHNGVRYDIPEIHPVPETPMPPARFFHVGKEWDDDRDSMVFMDSGLRDHLWESLTEGSPCQPPLRTLTDGRLVWDLASGPTFSMNEESVAFIVDFELDHLVRLHRDGYGHNPGGIVAGFKWYAQFGALQIGSGQTSKIDEILRRTAWKSKHGLTVDYSIDDLLARSVRFADLPPKARTAWHHKATTESAQTELVLAA